MWHSVVVGYLDGLVPGGGGEPLLLRVPVAGEDGPRVRRELRQRPLVAPHVPHLHGAVLRHGRERVRRVRAELHVTDRLRVAVQIVFSFTGFYYQLSLFIETIG